MIDDYKKDIIALNFISGMMGFFAGMILEYFIGNTIPSIEKVESGYVVPSKLEVKVKDLNGNGISEVIMRYDNKDYLLTIDGQGKPKVQSYEIKPTIEDQKKE